jgi:hypothetical protein
MAVHLRILFYMVITKVHYCPCTLAPQYSHTALSPGFNSIGAPQPAHRTVTGPFDAAFGGSGGDTGCVSALAGCSAPSGLFSTTTLFSLST